MHAVSFSESVSEPRLRNLRIAADTATRAQRRAVRHQVRSCIPSSDLEAEQLLTPSIDPRHEWFFLSLVIVAVALVLLTVVVSA